MKQIRKDNLEEFLDYYHGCHDSYIKDVKYEFLKDKVEFFIDVFWSGNPTIKDDGTYETNRKKMHMVCSNVVQYNYKENYSDSIDDVYLNYLRIKNKEYICFATDKEKPLISVVCENIWYEEFSDEKKCQREDEIRHIHEEITKIYDYATDIYERLKDKCELGYFNRHIIKIHEDFVEQSYYMPVISMQDKGDICFNFDDVSYEYYLTRAQLQKNLKFLFENYQDKISIYPSSACTIDLYNKGEDINAVNARLDEYNETEIIGITIDANSFSDKNKIDNFLKIIEKFDGE